ncbi:MAG: putative DNA modification/repair radical SAM protein [Bdellovibrionota bacterium]
MTLKEKLEILASAAKYDASCASSGSYRKRDADGIGNTEGMGICHSYTPDGRCISLFKVLFTNSCIYDCKFCINRLSSDTKRARFTVEDVVWLTMEFYRRNYIEGLFLSSGIFESVDGTMEKLTEVARRLRVDEKFGGYIHLKVVPGADERMIERAGLYADRVSANIELPTQLDLDQIATAKKVDHVFDSMTQIKEKIIETKESKLKLVKPRVFAPAGQTTQMIVGATKATDRIILDRTQQLYKDYRLRRVYYSAYSPIPNADAALPSNPPVLIRENRLYQSDWLLRFYGFKTEELTFENGNLALDLDPKSAWALKHREYFPVDVNTATREQLLRVPGFGVKNVDRIINLRRHRGVSLDDLRKLRVPLTRAKYFVTTSDDNPGVRRLDSVDLDALLKPREEQLSLFDQKPA